MGKNAIPRFMLDSKIFFEKSTDIIDQFGAKGFAILVFLYGYIHNGEGWYCETTNGLKSEIARRLRVRYDLVSQVIDRAVRLGTFNETLFKRRNIVTSESIQENYAKAVKKRSFNLAVIPPECLLVSSTLFGKNIAESGKNEENENIDETRKDKNLTPKKEIAIKEREGKISGEALSIAKNLFKSAFPGKDVDKVQFLPPDINIELLIEKIKESPQWLMANDAQFDFLWCVKNYRKILSGKYNCFTRDDGEHGESDLIKKIMERYTDNLTARQSEIYAALNTARQHDDFIRIENELSGLYIEVSRAAAEAKPVEKSAHERIKTLEAARAAWLRENNLKTEINYNCEICKDTGRLGTELCDCVKVNLYKKLSG